MAESTKRLHKRKAATDSQRRWKEVLDEELGADSNIKGEMQEAEPDPDFDPGEALAYEFNTEAVATNLRSRSREAKPKVAADPLPSTSGSTLMDEKVLKGIVSSLACSKCSSKNLLVKIDVKNKETQNLHISCSDCEEELFKDDVPKCRESPSNKCRGSCSTPKRSKHTETEPSSRAIKFREILTDPILYETSSDDSASDEDDVGSKRLMSCDAPNEDHPQDALGMAHDAEEKQIEAPHSIAEDGREEAGSEDPRHNVEFAHAAEDPANEAPARSTLEMAHNTDEKLDSPGDSSALQILSENIVNPPRKKKGHMKPLRPCVFCSKMFVRLSIHLKTDHLLHPFVQNMVQQPPDVQSKMMRQLRCEGIFAENQRRMTTGPGDLLRIRDPESRELLVCFSCKGYFSKKLMWSHKLTCVGKSQICGGSFIKNSLGCMKPRKRGRPSKAEVALRLKDQHIREVLVADVSPHSVCFDQNASAGTLGSAQVDHASSEAQELQRIGQLVDGISPNPHLPYRTNAPPSCVKQEGMDRNLYQNGYVPHSLGGVPQGIPPPNMRIKEETQRGSQQPPPTRRPHGGNNEDQLIFENIPSILGNGAPDNTVRAPQAPPKKRSRESWSDYDDDNYYFMSDFQGEEMQDMNVVSFNSYGQPMIKKRKSRSEFQYKFWTKEEEQRILNYFTELISYGRIPGKDACKEFLKENTDIETDWSRVKYKVYNEIQKRKKRARKIEEQSMDDYEEFLEPGHHVLSDQSMSSGQVPPPVSDQCMSSGQVSEQCMGSRQVPPPVSEPCMSGAQAPPPVSEHSLSGGHVLPAVSEQCMSGGLAAPTVAVSEPCMSGRPIPANTSEHYMSDGSIPSTTSEQCMSSGQILPTTSEHCMSSGRMHSATGDHCMSSGQAALTSDHTMINEHATAATARGEQSYMEDQQLVINEKSLIPEQTMSTGHPMVV